MRWVLPFLGAHLLLGVAIRALPAIATLHAVGCVLAAVVIAAIGRPRTIACVISYITGAEVLWRMAHADVFHEVAKYSVSLVLLIALLRFPSRRNRWIALVYMLLLVPSTLLTIVAMGGEARDQISFNLSGPFSLMLCVIFFSNVRITIGDLRRIFYSLMGPLVAISTLVYLSTAAIQELTFKGDSNHSTSGGFGPNQVSGALGLGVLFAMLMLFDRKQRWRSRGPLLAMLAVFAVQAALTFSRGGIVLALASGGAAMAFLMRDARRRATVIVVATFGFAIANYVIIPRLESFTGGEIGERYSDSSSTGRVKLAGYDLQIFEDHPLIGVGPGMATSLRAEMGRAAAAHTEYTRMLAEHGLLGVLAIVVLGVLVGKTYRTVRGVEDRALVVAMLSWFTLFLLIYGTRLVAPSVVLGLGCSIAFSSLPAPAKKRAPAALVPARAAG